MHCFLMFDAGNPAIFKSDRNSVAVDADLDIASDSRVQRSPDPCLQRRRNFLHKSGNIRNSHVPTVLTFRRVSQRPVIEDVCRMVRLKILAYRLDLALRVVMPFSSLLSQFAQLFEQRWQSFSPIPRL